MSKFELYLIIVLFILWVISLITVFTLKLLKIRISKIIKLFLYVSIILTIVSILDFNFKRNKWYVNVYKKYQINNNIYYEEQFYTELKKVIIEMNLKCGNDYKKVYLWWYDNWNYNIDLYLMDSFPISSYRDIIDIKLWPYYFSRTFWKVQESVGVFNYKNVVMNKNINFCY